MAQWDIPHDERHQFLQFGPRDEVFKAWCDDFDEKGIKYEVGGGRDSWTIYKHLLHADINSIKIDRCCPGEEDL